MAVALVLGVFGSAIGSFLNVVAYRVPAGRSVVSPSSACGKCGHAIRWYDNIPVLSWFLLRGRCRDCSARISARYPLVEAGTAVFFGLVTWHFLPGLVAADSAPAIAAAILELAAFLYLATISVVLAIIDLDVRRLPNVIVLPAYVVAAAAFTTVAALDNRWDQLLVAGLGLGIAGVVFLLPAFIRPGSMGMGDVKLAGVLGAFLGWLGWNAWATGFIVAFIAGGIFGLVLIALKRGRKAKVPFGPWLLGGAWVGIFVGDIVVTAYLGLFGLG
jgi:leader peptidase (prepilin peptidase) / N-methyltransferase